MDPRNSPRSLLKKRRCETTTLCPRRPFSRWSTSITSPSGKSSCGTTLDFYCQESCELRTDRRIPSSSEDFSMPLRRAL